MRGTLYKQLDNGRYVAFDPREGTYLVVGAEHVPPLAPLRLSQAAAPAPGPKGDGGRKARALLLMAMLEFQRRAHRVGMPDAAQPYLDHLAKLAADPTAAKKAIRLSWRAEAYTDGRQHRWQFKAIGEGPDAGRVLYGAEAQRAVERQQQRGAEAQATDERTAAAVGAAPPEPGRHPEKGYSHRDYKAKQAEASKAATDFARGSRWKDITHEHLRGFAQHLPYLPVGQLKRVRTHLNMAFDATFGGKTRRAAMVESLMGSVRKELDRMDAEANNPVVDPPGGKLPEGDAAAADAAPARDYPAGVPKQPQPGKAYRVPVHSLKVDPERFQFKMGVDKKGVTDEFKGVKFNPDLAGVLTVWRDPETGEDNVVNGHHRHEMAARSGASHLNVIYSQAKTAKEARAAGALVNIAEGKGTAVDAAKFLRDSGLSADDIAAKGISLKGKVAEDAAHLSKLGDATFAKVARGHIDPNLAVAVAKHVTDPDRQAKLLDRIQSRDADGKDTSPKLAESMARQMAALPAVKKDGADLFSGFGGAEEDDVFDERAALAHYVGATLAKEHGDWSAVSSEARAGKVADAGNTLNTDENQKRRDELARARETYHQLEHRSGPIAEALTAGAVGLKKAKTKQEKDDARARALESVRAAVRAEHAHLDAGGGGVPAPADAGGAGAGAGGRGEVDRGDAAAPAAGLTAVGVATKAQAAYRALPPNDGPPKPPPPREEVADLIGRAQQISKPLAEGLSSFLRGGRSYSHRMVEVARGILAEHEGAAGGAAEAEQPAADPFAHAAADHTPAVKAIKPGELAWVAGHQVRALPDGKYQVETKKAYHTGTAADIAARIHDTWKMAAAERSPATKAMERAAAYQEPTWFGGGSAADEQARRKAAVPAGARAVSLDEHTRGRVGEVVRDENGAARLRLDGSTGLHATDFEPLESRFSWRTPEAAKEAAAPKAKTGDLFAEKPAGFAPRPNDFKAALAGDAPAAAVASATQAISTAAARFPALASLPTGQNPFHVAEVHVASTLKSPAQPDAHGHFANGTLQVRHTAPERGGEFAVGGQGKGRRGPTHIARDMGGVVRHEIGHSIEAYLKRHKPELWGDWLDAAYAANDEAFRQHDLVARGLDAPPGRADHDHPNKDASVPLSGLSYSISNNADNAREALAESVAAYTDPNYGKGGQRLPRTIEQFLDRLGGSDPVPKSPAAPPAPKPMTKAEAKAMVAALPVPKSLPDNPADYFLVDEADATVPLEKIKNLRQRPEGVENAAKFMEASRRGLMPKRSPLKVVDNGDGTYTVADGNSTFANAKRNGWKNLPVKLVPLSYLHEEQRHTVEKEHTRAGQKMADDKFFTPEELALPKKGVTSSANDQAGLYAAAEKAKPTFDKILDSGEGVEKALGASVASPTNDAEFNAAISQPGPVVIVAPLKGPKRAAEKVAADYGGNWNQLHDIVRASVAVDTAADIPKAMDALKKELAEKGWKLAKKPKNRFSRPTLEGYSDVMLNVVGPEGVVSEVQIHLKGMLKAKQEAHHLYEQERSLAAKMKTEGRKATRHEAAEMARLISEQRKIYGSAWLKSLGLHEGEGAADEVQMGHLTSLWEAAHGSGFKQDLAEMGVSTEEGDSDGGTDDVPGADVPGVLRPGREPGGDNGRTDAAVGAQERPVGDGLRPADVPPGGGAGDEGAVRPAGAGERGVAEPADDDVRYELEKALSRRSWEGATKGYEALKSGNPAAMREALRDGINKASWEGVTRAREALDRADKRAVEHIAANPQPPATDERVDGAGERPAGLPARQPVGDAAAAGRGARPAATGEGVGGGAGAVPAGADGGRPDAVRATGGPGNAAGHGEGDRPRRTARRVDGAPRAADGTRLGGGLDGSAPAIPDPTPAEHVVAEPPAPENPTDVSAGNFRYADREFFKGGAKSKFQANLAAVRALRQIEAEGRTTATPEEQAILSRFTGWGQFPGVFNEFRDASTAAAGPDHDPGRWGEERKALRSVLSDEEWEAAKRSTLNAHYTHPDVVDAHWKAAERLGFKGGRYLETSAGIGYYLGLMPGHLAARTHTTAVELDHTTGGMLKLLYPKANTQVQGFQDHNAPDDYYDLIASNVPFGAYRVHDPKYNRHQANIHDYFFLKSADKVRPGGLMMHITSTGTLDKADKKIREELYKTHDLVAAIRFPGAAHKENAGTDVVTDMVILRKRLPGESPGDASWLETTTVPDPAGGEPIPVNGYFAKNPQQILGTLDRTGSMYQGNSVNVSRPADYEQRLAAALGRLPQNVVAPRRAPAKRFEPAVLPAPGEVKDGGFHLQDGKVFVREGGAITEQKMKPAEAKRVGGHLTVRDALRAVLRAETAGEDATAARADLNRVYDEFVKEHGPLNAPANRRLFGTDPDSPAVLALEKWDAKTKTAKKADIFTKPTVSAAKPVERVGSVAEGVGVSLHEFGRLDVAHIAKLTGQHPDAVGRQLTEQGLAYEDPSRGWEPADHYLSGNVRQKLVAARAAAANDHRYAPNVAALERVQPEDVHHDDIDVKLGAPWVPPADVRTFAAELLGARPEGLAVTRNGYTGEWKVEYSGHHGKTLARSGTTTQVWGTRDVGFKDLLEAGLNGVPVTVTKADPNDPEKRVVDREATDAANAKMQEIKNEFKGWVWADPARRERLHRFYNDNFNNIRNIRYDGSHLKLPGSNPAIQLRPHQKNFVWQVVTTGKGLAGHEVGTGKTYTMAAAAMELRRLGLARKPAILCKKANVDAVTQDALKLYPGAKILSTADMFTADKRKQTIARIATGDYDMVVMTHDHFDSLPARPETQAEYLRGELAELEAAYQEAWDAAGADAKNDKVVKGLQKAKQNLEAKLQEALSADKKDDAVYFEDLGIDHLFVDESHRYKSLPVYTKMRGLKGVPQQRSDRATDMLMKSRWLMRHNGGRGLVFCTGTPIPNSMAELYNNQRYLQPEELEQRGVKNFDAWANTFGEVETNVEYTATGEYKPVSRFSKFTNIPELMQISRQVLDVQRADDLKNPDGSPVIKRPKRKDAVTVAPKGDGVRALMSWLNGRAQQIKGKRPGESGDNMLSICTDGRKGSIDLRMTDIPGFEGHDDPDSKTNRLVRNVLAVGKAHPGKTQMIFSDIGANPMKNGFHLYGDIIDKLAKGGIPREKIADFTKFTTQKQREDAIQGMRDGTVLVAIGGTDTLGTGVNAQHKLVALHHLDCPWRPSDLEQRDGRGWRHGNENPEVQIHRYVTEGSLDELLWQTISRKSRFIKQVLSPAEKVGRTAAEEDTEELSPEAVMAAASGDPRILQRVQLEQEVRDLTNAHKRHEREQESFAGSLRRADAEAAEREGRIEDYRDAAATLEQNPKFSLTFGGQTYTDRKDGVPEAFEKHVENAPPYYTVVGTFRGLPLVKEQGRLYLQTGRQRLLTSGTLPSVEAVAARTLRSQLEAEESGLAQHHRDTAQIREKQGRPFPKAEVLKQRQEQLHALERELAHIQPDAADEPGGETPATPAGFHTYSKAGGYAEAPDAEPVTVPGLDGHEFFVSYDESQKGYRVFEARSGLAAGPAQRSKKAAIAEATTKLAAMKDRLADVVEKHVKESGPSPRYTAA